MYSNVMKNFKVTITEDLVIEEWGNWNMSKHRTNLRFGQHFLNKYLADNCSCPEIYYDKNDEDVFSNLIKTVYNCI